MIHQNVILVTFLVIFYLVWISNATKKQHMLQRLGRCIYYRGLDFADLLWLLAD